VHWLGGFNDLIMCAIFRAAILDGQQMDNKFGIYLHNTRRSHCCGYAGACKRGTAV
jgi:hypothetical protein